MESQKEIIAMLTTQHSDLLWLAKCNIPVSIVLVPTKHKGETWYQMLVEPQGAAHSATLLNRSGAPRQWKNLSAAVRFVARTLRHVESITVQIGKRSSSGELATRKVDFPVKKKTRA